MFILYSTQIAASVRPVPRSSISTSFAWRTTVRMLVVQFICPNRTQFLLAYSSSGQGNWPWSRLSGYKHRKVFDRATERDIQVRDKYTDHFQAEPDVGHDQLSAGTWQHDAAGAAQEHRVSVPQDQAKQVSIRSSNWTNISFAPIINSRYAPHCLILTDRILYLDATRRQRRAIWPLDPVQLYWSGRMSGRCAWNASSGAPANAVESNRKRNMSERISISYTWLGIGFCINCTVYSSFWPFSASCFN